MTHYTHMLQDENGVVWFYQPPYYYEVEIRGIGLKVFRDTLCIRHKNFLIDNYADFISNLHISVEPIHGEISVCGICHRNSLKDEEVRK